LLFGKSTPAILAIIYICCFFVNVLIIQKIWNNHIIPDAS